MSRARSATSAALLEFSYRVLVKKKEVKVSFSFQTEITEDDNLDTEKYFRPVFFYWNYRNIINYINTYCYEIVISHLKKNQNKYFQSQYQHEFENIDWINKNFNSLILIMTHDER